MKYIALLAVVLLSGCAWMVGTVDDQGRIIDGNGNFVGYMRHDPFGGRSATCSTSSVQGSGGQRTINARCW